MNLAVDDENTNSIISLTKQQELLNDKVEKIIKDIIIIQKVLE